MNITFKIQLKGQGAKYGKSSKSNDLSGGDQR